MTIRIDTTEGGCTEYSYKSVCTSLKQNFLILFRCLENLVLDQDCKEHAIEHRLTSAFHPQTGGMVERFDPRVSKYSNPTTSKPAGPDGDHAWAGQSLQS